VNRFFLVCVPQTEATLLDLLHTDQYFINDFVQKVFL
jgi:hypothetical protein